MSILFSGCTKYVAKAPAPTSRISFSRVATIDSIPSVVAGGSVLPLQFQQVTADATGHGIRKWRNKAERIVRYSVDGGESFADAGVLGHAQDEFELDVPTVDTTLAMVQLIAQSEAGVEVLLQSPIFEIRSSGPVLSQTRVPYNHYSNTDQVIFGGGCESPFAVTVTRLGTTPTVLGEASCTNNSWQFTVSSTVDGQIGFRFSAIDSVNHNTAVNSFWTRDTVAPQIATASYRVAAAAPLVTTNYVPVALDASDAATNVTHFCLLYAFNAAAVATPVDTCWARVNDPEPGLPPAKTLALRDFIYRLGYVGGSYGVSAWVRDAAGNISNRVSATVLYQPGIPPRVINVVASRTDPATLPFTPSDLSIPEGSPVIIRWKIASAPNGLTSTPVSLYYTQDDVTFTPITVGVADVAHGGCGLSSGLFSGCYVWNSTVGSTSYFRVRVAIQDRNGMVASSSTNPLNGTGLSLIAGNTDAGVGSSAQAAIFLSPRFGYIVPDSGSLVVSNRGNIFFRDYQKGILWVQPNDGIVRVLMPLKTAASNTYEGPLASAAASVKNPLRIALDFENGLLVWDYDRIRRIDMDTMAVSTLIGGGSSSADDVGPREVLIQPRGGTLSYQQVLAQMIPLPNGNILFESESYYTNQARLRVYTRFNNKVTSIQVSGSGHSSTIPGVETDHATEDLNACASEVNGVSTSCYRASFVVEYNPANFSLKTLHLSIGHRVPGNIYYPVANLTPSGGAAGTSLAPHPPDDGNSSATFVRAVGQNGGLYAVNRFNGRISRFDKASNTWVKLVGAASAGTCPDGTPALACAIQPSDAYVDGSSNLFFLDRGQVRTVDGAGNVVTVYGQSHFFGDGGLAQSARFNVLPNLDQGGNGEIVVLDTVESRIRSFMPGGNIQTLAGDGSVGVRPNFTDPAATQPFSVSGAGKEFSGFVLDPTTNDVFSTAGMMITRLRRSTGKWEPLVASPAPSYIPNIVGFDGTNVLVHSNRFDFTANTYADALFRLVGADNVLSPYAGVLGSIPPQFCADGTVLTSCAIPASVGALGVGLGKTTWDAPRDRWLATEVNTTRVVTLGRGAGATIGTLSAVARPVSSFAYANDGGGEHIYYCATNGRLYDKNLGTGIETALEWRIPSMSCSGFSMIYRVNKLIFTVVQSGLSGVAEYVLP